MSVFDFTMTPSNPEVSAFEFLTGFGVVSPSTTTPKDAFGSPSPWPIVTGDYYRSMDKGWICPLCNSGVAPNLARCPCSKCDPLEGLRTTSGG